MASVIKTVGVISTGVIGSSFIALFLANGLRVLVCSPSVGAEERLSKYLENVWPTLKDSLSPGASLSNYKFVGETLDGYYDQVDFIQENAPEKLDLKQKLFAELDTAARPEVIIASSSSGFPSSKFITDCKKHSERILIGHPFNPPHIIPLIEVVPHPNTSPDVCNRTLEFYKSLGKRPILVKQEVPGFIANRLQVAMYKEAYSLVLRGVVSAEELDACMTEGLGPRWALTGPFMTSTLGGGGGKEGFVRILTHLMPAAKMWDEDMKHHEFQFDKDSIPILNEIVQKMLEKYDMDVFVNQNAKLLVDILKAKDEAAKARHVTT